MFFEVIYFFLIIILGIYSFFVRRPNNVLPVVCLILMAFIFAFNTDNNDYDAYYSFYNSVKLGEADYINYNSNSSAFFSYSMAFLKSLGVNFNFYRLIMFILLILPIILLFKNKLNWGIVVSGYGMVMFFFDLVQLRFTWAEYLLFIGIFFLITGRRLWYVIFVIAGSLFHSMVLPFAFFAILPTSNKASSIFTKIAPIIIVVVVAASILGRSVIENLQNTVAAISLFDEYDRYMEQNVSYGYLLYVVYQLFNILLARFCFKHERTEADSSIAFSFNKLNYLIQIVGFLFVIPAMLNVNFSRFIRVLYLINCLNLACCFKMNKSYIFKKSSLRLEYFLLFVCVNVIWVVGETFANGAYPMIKERVFSSLNVF